MDRSGALTRRENRQRRLLGPRDNEVLVAIRAASINSWDWDLLRGIPFPLRLRKPRHRILGADVAGRGEKVGRSVEKLRPGDEVFGDLSACRWGGFAEYVCVPEDALAPKSIGTFAVNRQVHRCRGNGCRQTG